MNVKNVRGDTNSKTRGTSKQIAKNRTIRTIAQVGKGVTCG